MPASGEPWIVCGNRCGNGGRSGSGGRRSLGDRNGILGLGDSGSGHFFLVGVNVVGRYCFVGFSATMMTLVEDTGPKRPPLNVHRRLQGNCFLNMYFLDRMDFLCGLLT